MKQDQMSMASSIESRVPFLDHTLVEFAMSVPDRLKIHGNIQKHIFKEAVSDLLPAGIVHRKKMGFPHAPAPVAERWARVSLFWKRCSNPPDCWLPAAIWMRFEL